MDPKRTEPHDRVQGATDLRGTRGGNRRSREERQGRNELGVGIFEPKGGQPSGSGRAARISMEGRLWKTPGEEFELPAQVGWSFGFVPMTGAPEIQPRAQARSLLAARKRRDVRTACIGERPALSVSEGDVKVTRAACQWHTSSRDPPKIRRDSVKIMGGVRGRPTTRNPRADGETVLPLPRQWRRRRRP